LTGRNKEKLQILQKDLVQKYSIQVEIIPIDLSNDSAPKDIFDFCQKKEIKIDILINNAGYAIRTQDEILYPSKVSSMLHLMVLSLTELCNLFIPSMIERKSGYILNVSSIVGCFPAASTLTYCAAKRYIIDYSRYLHFELNRNKIHVTCLMPGPTKTNFSNNNQLPIPKKLLVFYLSSDQVALEGLRALYKNKVTFIPGKISKFITFLGRLIPPSILYNIQKRVWVNKRDRYG